MRTNLYTLAVIHGKYVYGIHNKIYTNKKVAENALRKMIVNEKLPNIYRVHEIAGFMGNENEK